MCKNGKSQIYYCFIDTIATEVTRIPDKRNRRRLYDSYDSNKKILELHGSKRLETDPDGIRTRVAGMKTLCPGPG